MDTCFIQTKGSLNRKTAEKEFSAISFESYKPKPKPVLEESHKDETESQLKSQHHHKDAPELNIKRAKQEIIRFGMTGFDAATQEDAKIKLAIKLGKSD